MTVNNCIAYIDSIEPNAYTAAQKAMWISECEGKVYTDLFLLQPNEFTPVTYDADKDRTLALPAPYDRLYPRYLQAMIHYANGEYDRYANSMAAFNEVWGGLHRWFGANYDVSDRKRNRRVTVSVQLPNLDNAGQYYNLITVPQGCALVGGRIVVKKADRYMRAGIRISGWASGTYNFRDGDRWQHFVVDEALSSDYEYLFLDRDEYPHFVRAVDPYEPHGNPDVDYAILGGKATGTDLDFVSPIRLSFGGDVVAEAEPDLRGGYPIPMLIADRGGTDFGVAENLAVDTLWECDGEILFTARLLVPDEEFPFN